MELARLTARNTAPDSENRMHADDVARRFGFRAGLVPGVTVYGYLAATLGPAFLTAGGMRLRLLRPVYDGDPLVIERIGDTLTARDPSGEACAVGVLDVLPDPGDIPESPLPDPRPPATAATLAPGLVLGTIERELSAVEPGALLELSNRVLMANFLLGPWLHASSDLQHAALPDSGERLRVHARIADRFARKGHQFVTFDVRVLGHNRRLIQTVRHTAIYQPRRPDATE